jgi:glycine/D-amino acid oxidase-like deaminating enzyme
MTAYDIAVIGKGLIGSGAIRHLALSQPDLKLCIIGPDEPQNRKTHEGVFASHYDQGRITRVLDPSPIWGQLARQSIAQYPLIESSSGIQFHHRVGCLRATDIQEKVDTIDAVADKFSPPYTRLNANDCQELYPFLSFSDDFTAWDETGDAGYINPRALIQAQLKVAENNGATIIRKIVDSIIDDADIVTIQTRDGETIRAKKVLISTGGYTNTLLDTKLELPTKTHTILLVEVDKEDIQRLQTMPSIISTFDHPDVSSLYMLPPVVYPDGKTYIKLGASGRKEELTPAEEHYLDTVDNDTEVLDWFHTDGRADIVEHLKKAVHRMIPNLNVLSYQSVPCLLTYTAHGNPYIDKVGQGIYIATGGNGAAAKSSDEIGRLGAVLTATDIWDSELNREDFRAVGV